MGRMIQLDPGGEDKEPRAWGPALCPTGFPMPAATRQPLPVLTKSVSAQTPADAGCETSKEVRLLLTTQRIFILV